MLSTTYLLSALLALAPLVSAHGAVRRIAVGETIYTGPAPGTGSTAPSPIRQIANNGPVLDPTSADMACGNGAHTPASFVAPAQAGARLAFQWWNDAANSPWIHQVGPMLTYMAACTGTTCDKFDASKAQWFKIDQIGQTVAGGANWFQNYTYSGYSTTVTLPPTLAPGDYLVRHEIIALHRAATQGEAEFYPSCTQLRVSGAGTATPAAAELVKFPGAYAATDKGILVDVFSPPVNYVMPGPALSKLAVSGGSAITVRLPEANATAVAATKREVPGSHRVSRFMKGGARH